MGFACPGDRGAEQRVAVKAKADNSNGNVDAKGRNGGNAPTARQESIKVERTTT